MAEAWGALWPPLLAVSVFWLVSFSVLSWLRRYGAKDAGRGGAS